MRTPFLFVGLAALLLCGAGCASPSGTTISVPSSSSTNTPSSETPPAAIAFGVPATFSIGERKTFQDGVVLELKAINDSRCKPGVQCFWAGELSPVFLFSGADHASQELTLGTIRAAQVTIGDFAISLKDATTERATIVVSKK